MLQRLKNDVLPESGLVPILFSYAESVFHILLIDFNVFKKVEGFVGNFKKCNHIKLFYDDIFCISPNLTAMTTLFDPTVLSVTHYVT